MQRSISHQNYLTTIAYVVFFLLYSSLSSIYPLLPPMFSVLFILYMDALKRDDTLYIFLVSLCLVIFEANGGYVLFSSIIYLYLVYKFVMPKVEQSFSCPVCIKITSLLLAYLGYYLFLTLIANVFLLEHPNISYYIVYYIVIEFFIVSLL